MRFVLRNPSGGYYANRGELAQYGSAKVSADLADAVVFQSVVLDGAVRYAPELPRVGDWEMVAVGVVAK